MRQFIEPVFQPIADAHGRTFGLEALLRFRGYPDRSPDQSLRRWEKTGFIRTVDRAMLASVVEALARIDFFDRPTRVAVNVSVATIEADGDGYRAALGALADLVQRVIVEVTETAPITNAASVLRFAAECRAAGYHLALDDCKPSHPYGREEFMRSVFPTLVKIDGEFLCRCHAAGEVSALRRMIDAAHALGARVIAEHVADEAIRDFALRQGADLLQGFAIGRPASLARCVGERRRAA
ncbi:putative uncharacterized protein [Burkholderiales bacterium GJ-E10]|nr:putative uncharacterized protein [Burkholderiales bacterium GJ-E10]